MNRVTLIGKRMDLVLKYVRAHPGATIREICDGVYGEYTKCTKRNSFDSISRLERRRLVIKKRGVYFNRYWAKEHEDML